MLKALSLLSLFALPLFSQAYSERDIKNMIGQMLIVGFEDEKIRPRSKISHYIKEYSLGGVILFDRFYTDRSRVKNIRNPKQLKELTKELQLQSNRALIIAIDQEGGKVARLKKAYGFSSTPSAAEIGKRNDVKFAHIAYSTLANQLSRNGINCNFAPVVDLALNPKNRVIYGLERSFGASSQKVSKFASIALEEFESAGVIGAIKHFPGHGSSLSDSHEGFVDISESWSEKELEPYRKLIKDNRVSMIMTAHVFNKYLDSNYPATLSKAINIGILREKMGYKGVIVSDDLQMRAITKQYSLKESVTLAINAGVDMLLFGNQLAKVSVDEVVDIIFNQVKSGDIPINLLVESNARIRNLHKIQSRYQGER